MIISKNVIHELANESIQKQRLEDQKKEITADYKAKIDKKQANINVLAQHLSSGKEMREIRCRVYLNVPIDSQKTIIRTDTNPATIVQICEMEAHEFQEQIPFQETGNVTENTDTAKETETENDTKLALVESSEDTDITE